MSNQSAQAQTVANALSGEKAFETVRFAVTGNENADALAGIQAVLSKIPLNRNSPIPHARYAAMLLKYLAECYAVEAQAQEEQAKLQQFQIHGIHPGPLINPAYPNDPPPYAHPPYSHDWATTAGTAGLGSAAPKISDGDALDRLNSILVAEQNEKRAAILRDLMINKPPV